MRSTASSTASWNRPTGPFRGAGGADPNAGAGAFRDGLAELEQLIRRHLEDEEDLIVPVILIHGADGLG